MPDQLVHDADLVTWLGLADGALTTERAIQALEVATGWVQDDTHQRLLSVANETVILELKPGHSVWLPERPVTAVGTILTTDVYGVNTARTFHVDYTIVGSEIRWLYWVGWTAVTATVTYSHGYSTAPQGVRGVILSAAARIISNPGGARSQTIDDYSVSYGGGSGFDSGPLTQAERNALERYRSVAV